MFVGRSVGVIVVEGETSLGGEPPDARARRAGGLYRPIMPSPCNSRALQGIREAEGKENEEYEPLCISRGRGRWRCFPRGIAGETSLLGGKRHYTLEDGY